MDSDFPELDREVKLLLFISFTTMVVCVLLGKGLY